MSDFYNKYPYTDFHELNLDWVLKRVKKLTEDWLATHEEWVGVQQDWADTEQAWIDFKAYVENYLANLDVQDEIDNKINAMILDGSFETIIRPTVISQTTAATEAWLAAHIVQPTTPVVDNTLSIPGAAADSAATGAAVSDLQDQLDEITGSYLNDIVSDHVTHSVAAGGINRLVTNATILGNYTAGDVIGIRVNSDDNIGTLNVVATINGNFVTIGTVTNNDYDGFMGTFPSGLTAINLQNMSYTAAASFDVSFYKNPVKGMISQQGEQIDDINDKYDDLISDYRNYHVGDLNTVAPAGGVNRKISTTALINGYAVNDMITIRIDSPDPITSLRIVALINGSYVEQGYLDVNSFDGINFQMVENLTEIYAQNTSYTDSCTLNVSYYKNALHDIALFDYMNSKDGLYGSHYKANTSIAANTIINWTAFNAVFYGIQENDVCALKVDCEETTINDLVVSLKANNVYYRIGTFNSNGDKFIFKAPSGIQQIIIQKTSDLPSVAVTLKADLYINNIQDIGIHERNVPEENTFYVGASERYTTIRSGINAALNYKNAKVIIRPGTYDLIQEFGGQASLEANIADIGWGIRLYNGIHLIFEAGAKVVANYTGSNADVFNNFSCFSANASAGDVDRSYTIENLVLESHGTRYSIHDECSGQDGAYTHIYKNCDLSHDHSNNPKYARCIGGGLGEHGIIRIENCRFDTVKLSSEAYIVDVSYHNGDNANALSDVDISGCYFSGSFNALYYGPSTHNTNMSIHNCSISHVPEKDAAQGALIDNVTLIEYANELRP